MKEEEQKVNLNVYLGLIGVAIVIILLAVLWPKEQEVDEVTPASAPAIVLPASLPEPEVVEETFSPPPEPEEVIIETTEEAAPPPPVVIERPPVDTSDEGLLGKLFATKERSLVKRFLVSDNLLQRFVVLTTNVADDQNAPNHQLLLPPEQSFRTYQQAGKTWIDTASYKRYTPYTDLLESMSDTLLLELFALYRDDLQRRYNEIGDPSRSFDSVLVQAINRLLDTPEVPVPVEVYTDSVMFKYVDPRLENLSEPQKQLLRTGPDNMRRIKAKLRSLRQKLTHGS